MDIHQIGKDILNLKAVGEWEITKAKTDRFDL